MKVNTLISWKHCFIGKKHERWNEFAACCLSNHWENWIRGGQLASVRACTYWWWYGWRLCLYKMLHTVPTGICRSSAVCWITCPRIALNNAQYLVLHVICSFCGRSLSPGMSLCWQLPVTRNQWPTARNAGRDGTLQFGQHSLHSRPASAAFPPAASVSGAYLHIRLMSIPQCPVTCAQTTVVDTDIQLSTTAGKGMGSQP